MSHLSQNRAKAVSSLPNVKKKKKKKKTRHSQTLLLCLVLALLGWLASAASVAGKAEMYRDVYNSVMIRLCDGKAHRVWIR